VRAAVVTETRPGERRVAATPETVGKLAAAGWTVVVQSGAGVRAAAADSEYADRGAEIVGTAKEALDGAAVLLVVAPPSDDIIQLMPVGCGVIGLLEPTVPATPLRALADQRATAWALELLPRTSRAQSMDALSSQALVGGYRAVIEAALRLPRFFPMAMTAAGTVPPARIFVLGAGVAGLQAIATARRLGGVVEANDVRSAAAEEVKSLGAKFVDVTEGQTLEGAGGYAREATEEELAEQRARLADHLATSDVVITTAAVPGRRAPRLITTEMVERMRPGSVIFDLAAETGGNCELSKPGEDVVHNGVVIAGASNVPSAMAKDASALYARNVATFLLLMTKEGAFAPDFEDDLVIGACILRDGSPVHPLVKEALGA